MDMSVATARRKEREIQAIEAARKRKGEKRNGSESPMKRVTREEAERMRLRDNGKAE